MPRQPLDVTDELMVLWSGSFVDWSQGSFGFYVDRRPDPTRQRKWIYENTPIQWTEDQVRAFRHVLTVDETGHLPYTQFWYIDVAQSGKTLFGAALTQWSGMFLEHNAEIQLSANSKNQAEQRVFEALTQSLELHPYSNQIVDMTMQYVTFRATGNIVRTLPFNPGTQAGGTPVLRVFDELHEAEGEEANDYMAEIKPTPALEISFMAVVSYPPHEESNGPMNMVLKAHFTNDDQPKPHLKKAKGLEDLPLWTHENVAIWWNHDPLRYPWHTEKFLREVQNDPTVTESRFLRIWHAYRTSREETFMPMKLWDACEDERLAPLGPKDEKKPMVLAIDMTGGVHDTAAAIAREYDTVTFQYTLLAHEIWNPLTIKDESFDYNKAVEQWVIDLHRRHKVIACYYDETQFLGSAKKLAAAGVNMVKVNQNNARLTADTAYRQLIIAKRLRNYPQSVDMRKHVSRAMARETSDGTIRIVKKKQSGQIDAAVADSMCCYGVTEHIREFERLARRKSSTPQPAIKPRSSIFNEVFGMGRRT